MTYNTLMYVKLYKQIISSKLQIFTGVCVQHEMIFSNFEEYEIHNKNQHQQEAAFCKICNHGLRNSTALYIHNKRNHKRRPKIEHRDVKRTKESNEKKIENPDIQQNALSHILRSSNTRLIRLKNRQAMLKQKQSIAEV